MQGDCLSALLFIFYLAECLRDERVGIESSILIAPKYADDVTYAVTDKETQAELKRRIPIILDTHDLTTNDTKTEEYEIPKPPPPPPPPTTMEKLIAHKDDKTLWSQLDWLVNYTPPAPKDTTPDWTKCKLLGSLLETEADINRRKSLAITSLNTHNNIFKSKDIGNEMKIRTFNVYVSSVFLFNSELWATNESLNKKIDSYHRRLLRYAINFKWPKKISNDELYEKTKAIPWSRVIKKRRLTFLGHMMRRDEKTPVRIALKEALQPTDGKRGRPKNTWLKTIAKDLRGIIDINKTEESLNKLVSITENRAKWRDTVRTLLQY